MFCDNEAEYYNAGNMKQMEKLQKNLGQAASMER